MLEKGPALRASFPQRIMAMPRKKMEAPTVMMTRTMGWGFRTCLMASRSRAIPTPDTIPTERTIDRTRDSPSPCHREIRQRAPNMTSSPWAKLMSPVARYSMLKPRAMTA